MIRKNPNESKKRKPFISILTVELAGKKEMNRKIGNSSKRKIQKKPHSNVLYCLLWTSIYQYQQRSVHSTPLPNRFPFFHPRLHHVSTLLQILINTNSFPICYGWNDPNIAKEVENPTQMKVLATIESSPTRICWECTIDPNPKIKLNPQFLFIARWFPNSSFFRTEEIVLS